MLMSELGVHPETSFIDICDKYRKDVLLLETEIEKLNKEIEEKNSRLSVKEK